MPDRVNPTMIINPSTGDVIIIDRLSSESKMGSKKYDKDLNFVSAYQYSAPNFDTHLSELQLGSNNVFYGTQASGSFNTVYEMDFDLNIIWMNQYFLTLSRHTIDCLAYDSNSSSIFLSSIKAGDIYTFVIGSLSSVNGQIQYFKQVTTGEDQVRGLFVFNNYLIQHQTYTMRLVSKLNTFDLKYLFCSFEVISKFNCL